ncbi:MAG: phage baseplate assembly protein [Acetobacteraceae bacterium]
MSAAIAATVELTVDGLTYRGWRSMKCSLGLDAAAAEISIEMAERWAGAEDAAQIARSIRPGAAFLLTLEGEAVVEGFLDALEVAYDATNHTLTVRGRERTADLVDCAATVDGPYEWANIGLEEAARRIAEPYGIKVRAEAELGKAFPRFSIQPGEAAWEAIARAARERAVIATGDGLGTLILTRAGEGGEAAGALRLGGKDGNILRANGSFDVAERHDVVVVRGQAQGETSASQGEARATDEDIIRHRPKVILAEAQGEGVTFQDRAAHEVRVAAGKSRRVRYTVPGWRGSSGNLWLPNTKVWVEDAFLELKRELLISNVTFSLTEQGTVTELQVAPVDAYALLPEPGKGGGGESGPFETKIESRANDRDAWKRVAE